MSWLKLKLSSRYLAAGVGLVALYLVLNLLFGSNEYFSHVMTLAAINVILAVSLNLINGFTGQFSLGHAGFMAVGAYMAGGLTFFLKVPFLLALAAGSLAAGIVGFLVGLPTLRLRGDYLAIATLGFGEIIRVLIINSDSIGLPMLGGPRGVRGIPGYTSFGWAYLFAVITVLVIANFINSTHGRACISIREDEVAAEAMGIDTTRYKVLAFSIGAAFAGLAGGLFAHQLQLLHPDSYTFLKSVDHLTMVVLGGMGSITGAAVAGIFITVFSEALREVQDLRMIVYSLSLIVIMLVRPQGLMGGRELRLETFRRLLPNRRTAQTGGGARGTA
ncbi:MAG: branched-chain amino acid ABC transporter permease [Firmicutes bacterium]|nr:branched-chain amino acid ABC transporter permease [Bacillota bacterium]